MGSSADDIFWSVFVTGLGHPGSLCVDPIQLDEAGSSDEEKTKCLAQLGDLKQEIDDEKEWEEFLRCAAKVETIDEMLTCSPTVARRALDARREAEAKVEMMRQLAEERARAREAAGKGEARSPSLDEPQAQQRKRPGLRLGGDSNDPLN